MAKKNKGGRPKGAKDVKPRRRRAKTTKPKEPWNGKGRPPANKTKSALLLDQLRKYNFDPVQELINLFDNLKLQYELQETPEGGQIKIYPKDISTQMADILKVFITHSFPKLKALELSTKTDKPITLSFNLGEPQKAKKVESQEEKKEEAIDMVQGPGGFQLPVPVDRGKK
jgi:hypothetical protein